MLEVLPKFAKLQASYALGKPLALPRKGEVHYGNENHK